MEYIQYEFSDTNKIHSIEKNSDSNRKKYQNMELPLQWDSIKQAFLLGYRFSIFYRRLVAHFFIGLSASVP